MSGRADELGAAIGASARLLGVPCAPDRVRPILGAYEDALTADGGIVFSTETGTGGPRELQYTVQLSGMDDPHARAVSHGLVAGTDHPVAALLADLQERVPADLHALDGGVVGGFRKIYALFPRSQQGIPALAAVPSMPPALAGHGAFLARHGLDDVSVIGIDYRRRTVNVYFQLPAAGSLGPDTVLSLLRGAGLPDPDRRVLEFAAASYRVYVTLGWDSAAIRRMSFAHQPHRGLDLSALPTRPAPEVERLMTGAPYTYTGDRICTSAVKVSPDGTFFDLGSYHQVSPRQLTALTATSSRPAMTDASTR